MYYRYDRKQGEKIMRENLIQARKQRGLTQKQLALILEAEPSSICNWELGYRTPVRKYRQKLTKFFNIQEHILLVEK